MSLPTWILPFLPLRTVTSGLVMTSPSPLDPKNFQEIDVGECEFRWRGDHPDGLVEGRDDLLARAARAPPASMLDRWNGRRRVAEADARGEIAPQPRLLGLRPEEIPAHAVILQFGDVGGEKDRRNLHVPVLQRGRGFGRLARRRPEERLRALRHDPEREDF